MDNLSEIKTREIQDLYYQIANNSVAVQQTWLSILTDHERQHVADDMSISEAFQNGELSVISLYSRLRDCSLNIAIIEIARDLGLTSAINYRRLQHEIAEPPTPVTIHVEHPTWDKERGKLLWGTQVIRVVKNLEKSVNLVKILDAFHAQNWPPRIQNPLTTKKESLQLNDSIRTLNRNMHIIRFSADGSSMGIRWKVLETH